MARRPPQLDAVAYPAARAHRPRAAEYENPSVWNVARAQLDRIARRHCAPWRGKLVSPDRSALRVMEERR